MSILFGIPNDKQYLLEKEDISEVDRAEIELIIDKNKLSNYDENTIDDEDEILKNLVRDKLLLEIKYKEGYVEILKLVEELKRLLIRNMTQDIIFNPDKYQETLGKVKSLIDELTGR